MSERDIAYVGSIPELYDTHLVPLIFEPYAHDMARRVAASSPTDVLETAAGTGVVTRALAEKLGSNARYVVTDLNQPMRDLAKEKQVYKKNITWEIANAISLPYDDNSFDTVFCQFGVMFFPDKITGFTEARRVLKPDGNLIFSVWGTIENNDFANIVTNSAAQVFPKDPPLFLVRAPHGYCNVEQIKADLNAAGFQNIDVQTIDETSESLTPLHAANAYCQGPFRTEIETRDASLLGRVTKISAEAIAAQFGGGPVSGQLQAHVFTAAR